MKAGSVLVQCPQCDIAVNVPVSCEIANGGMSSDGTISVTCTPDMTALQAHIRAHVDEQS